MPAEIKDCNPTLAGKPPSSGFFAAFDTRHVFLGLLYGAAIMLAPAWAIAWHEPNQEDENDRQSG